jgi:mono/diheme cytochrome c family protein
MRERETSMPEARTARKSRRCAACGFREYLAATLLAAWPLAAAPASPVTETSGTRLYIAAGCIACHGAEGIGSTFAPMLPGHTAEQVKRYVRNPVGKMPRFGTDKLSDADLETLAAYIAALPAPETALRPPDALEAMEMHHWMAYRALKDEDPGHAEHHLVHAVELAADEAHRRSMDSILGLVRAKRNSRAAQGLLEIMSQTFTPKLTVGQMHLRLAAGALEAGDVPEAEHHVRHYVEAASPHDQRHAQQLLPLLRKRDVLSVKKRLNHLMMAK